jgi:CheY-like chemotaxis protein
MIILIVDDSKTMRRILKMAIKNATDGFWNVQMLEAENGEEALNIIQENSEINYLFLDINMPVMRGDRLLELIRNNSDFDSIKVVMQTSEGRKEKMNALINLGISGYILKPYTVDIATKMISEIFAKYELELS